MAALTKLFAIKIPNTETVATPNPQNAESMRTPYTARRKHFTGFTRSAYLLWSHQTRRHQRYSPAHDGLAEHFSFDYALQTRASLEQARPLQMDWLRWHWPCCLTKYLSSQQHTAPLSAAAKGKQIHEADLVTHLNVCVNGLLHMAEVIR